MNIKKFIEKTSLQFLFHSMHFLEKLLEHKGAPGMTKQTAAT